MKSTAVPLIKYKSLCEWMDARYAWQDPAVLGSCQRQYLAVFHETLSVIINKLKIVFDLLQMKDKCRMRREVGL